MMPTTITPSHTTRKSGRTVRKPSRMDDDIDTPNPMGVVVPLRHDLIAPKDSIRTVKSNKYRFAEGKCSASLPCTDIVSTNDVKYASSSSDDSKRYHRSDNYSKTHLYDKWMSSKDNCRDILQKNNNLHTSLSKVKKQLASSEKVADVVLETKKKLQASGETIFKLRSEKQSLTDTITSLNRDYKQLLESKANDKTHYDATLKLKVATLIQTHKSGINEFELTIKKKDLSEQAYQDEIKRLKEVVGANQLKLKNYDILSSQAFKANLQMKTFEGKAVVR